MSRCSIALSVGVTAVIASGLFLFAESSVGLFTSDQEVIRFGAMFLRTNVFFLLFNCVNHVMASALRGEGDSRGPMIVMLLTTLARALTLLQSTRSQLNFFAK